MRVRALWMIAFLAIAGTAIADDSWKSFRFEDDRFAIDFPDAPLTMVAGPLSQFSACTSRAAAPRIRTGRSPWLARDYV